MDEIIFLVVILVFGLIGHQIFYLIGKREIALRIPVSLFYMFFSAGTLIITRERIVWQFIFSIIIGILSNQIVSLINKKCTVDINPIWFGALGLLNIYVFYNIILNLFRCISLLELVFLFILGWGILILDFIFMIRKDD